MKNLVLYTFCACLISSPARAQVREPCGRPSGNAVSYTQPPSDVTRVSDCDLIRALPSQNSILLTIRCPSGPIEELEGFLHYKELTTEDYGRTWAPELPLKPVPSPLSTAWMDFAQAPSDAKVLYRYVQELGQYLRSEDGGRTFSLPQYSIDGLPPDRFLARFGKDGSYTLDFHLSAIDPRSPHKIYAGITVVPWTSMINMVAGQVPESNSKRILKVPGLYVSNDGGDSWSLFSERLENSVPIGISPSDPKIIYGQSETSVVKTEDGGKHWAHVGQSAQLSKPPIINYGGGRTSGGPETSLEIVQFAVDPTNPNVVFVVSNKGVYRSLDGGTSWRLLNLGFDELGSTHSLAIDAVRTAEIFVGTSMGVFYSADRGCSFRKIYPRR